MDRQKMQKSIFNIIIVLLLFGTVIKMITMICNICCISVMYNSYNEVRDYVDYRLAHLILEGKNPYTLDKITELNVPFMGLYSALYPLLAAIICKICGCTIPIGYYIANILLYLLTTYNIWLIVRKYFENKFAGFVCVAINAATFFSLYGLPIFNLHSDTVGIYITSLIYLLVFRDKRHTFFLAWLTVLLIFTKQILIVMAVPLFAFYLITDKKLALKYAAECVLCGTITFAVIQLVFPLYWTETIYAQFAVSRNYGNFKEAIKNIRNFYSRYNMYFFLILAGIIGAVAIRIRMKKRFNLKTSVMELIHEEYFVFLILNILFGTLSLLYFAKCGGDGYKYCQDILAAGYFLLAVYTWNKYFAKYFSQICHGDERIKQFAILAAVCIVSAITYSHFSSLYYTTEDIDTFTSVNNDLAAHSGEKMYLGMNATQYLVNKNIWEPTDIYFNDGQIEYFARKYPDLFIDRLFYEDSINKAAAEYVTRVNSMVENQEFGIIATCLDNVIDYHTLESNYYMYRSCKMKNEVSGPFELTLWLPREN